MDLNNEKIFCELEQLTKNDHGVFLYKSAGSEEYINIPYLLADYKDFLVQRGVIKDYGIILND